LRGRRLLLLLLGLLLRGSLLLALLLSLRLGSRLLGRSSTLGILSCVILESCNILLNIDTIHNLSGMCSRVQ